ncbi:MAG: MerR family transcriptional regulator [Chloroflexi bacterium]|nr:MerR family transcriptional regulator [Chloroflexota bacterium]
MLCGVSSRTIDYYTQRGLLAPATRSSGHQRRYDARAVRRLHLIKELQAERLTLREIAERLAAAESGSASAPALAARIRSMDEDLDRLNHELADVARHLERAGSPDDRRAVAQIASLALAKTLALAQWLATVARDGQPPLV